MRVRTGVRKSRIRSIGRSIVSFFSRSAQVQDNHTEWQEKEQLIESPDKKLHLQERTTAVTTILLTLSWMASWLVW